MSSIVVTTKNELKFAKENGYEEIIVKGNLAHDLKKSQSIENASVATIAIFVAVFVVVPGAAPASFLASRFFAASIAAATGIEIAAIIVAVSIGVFLIIAVFKDYEVISYKDGEMEMLLRKKDSKELEESRD
jgi:hypothetical protein